MSTIWDLRSSPMLNKVPEVTLIFWTIKILSTTVGETGADYLAVHVGLGVKVTAACMASLLIVALMLQLHARWRRRKWHSSTRPGLFQAKHH